MIKKLCLFIGLAFTAVSFVRADLECLQTGMIFYLIARDIDK